MTEHKTYIYGKHAVVEALINRPKLLKKVFLAPNFSDQELGALIKKSGVPTAELSGEIRVGSGAEKVIGLLSVPDLVRPFKDFAAGLAVDSDTSLVIMDEIQDPHNLGAIIRSAAAMGVAGVLIPEHNQAQVTSAVIKVSAGMAFRVPLVSVGNVNSTLRELKKSGFWIYGMDETATKNISEEKFEKPAVFVMGNEASGIRQKTRELCDILLSIPMNKRCESLNVAASAAITLYAWSLKHPRVLA